MHLAWWRTALILQISHLNHNISISFSSRFKRWSKAQFGNPQRNGALKPVVSSTPASQSRLSVGKWHSVFQCSQEVEDIEVTSQLTQLSPLSQLSPLITLRKWAIAHLLAQGKHLHSCSFLLPLHVKLMYYSVFHFQKTALPVQRPFPWASL